MVVITIALADDWKFKDTAENVKIQDYDAAPSGNPNPGQFAHKAQAGSSPFTIAVPENAFYGIHVDLEQCLTDD